MSERRRAPRHAVAVWVGNFEGDPMWILSGITGAAPAWRDIMDGLAAGGPVPGPRESRTSRSPADGLVIAIDPDMPDDRQPVPTTVEGAGVGLVVRLGDTVLGGAEAPILWAPRAGRHRITLADAAGGERDGVVVTVR